MAEADEQGRTAAEAPPTCDRIDNGKPCTAVAVWGYVWDWGESGVCCAPHGTALKQLEPSLGDRKCQLSPLAKPGPAPVTRDERTQLIAAKLAAEAEVDDLKARGLELYRENVGLAKQLQALTLREREGAKQLEEALRVAGELRNQLLDKDIQLADLVDEVSRLQKIAAFVDPLPEDGEPPPTPTSRVG